MMSYTGKVKPDAYKKFAEVFTPPGVVFDMILQEGIRPLLQGLDKTIFDPCVGEGQFPCAELVWKMFYNLDTLDETTALTALASLYGVDIQAVSIDKTREHLLATIKDAYEFFTGEHFTEDDVARAIAEENFIVGDSLKLMAKWSAPQLSLFD